MIQVKQERCERYYSFPIRDSKVPHLSSHIFTTRPQSSLQILSFSWGSVSVRVDLVSLDTLGLKSLTSRWLVVRLMSCIGHFAKSLKGLDVSPSTTTLATDISIPRYGSNHENQACLTQKAVVQVTLAGPGLILTVLAMIFAIQTLQPSLTCTLIALAPLFFIIHNDYENFILLGPGNYPFVSVTHVKL